MLRDVHITKKMYDSSVLRLDEDTVPKWNVKIHGTKL